MILGIGTDLAKISRFEKWIKTPDLYKRFFHEDEIVSEKMNDAKKCEHYASRFAAKEAFSKAMGTGVRDFFLSDICVRNNVLGKPELFVYGAARALMESKFGRNIVIHLSLSHEKEYALAFVVLEREEF